MQDWFAQHLLPLFSNLTEDTVKSWFVYNPQEPLLFNTGLFLGFFLVFYSIYIALKNTFYPRMVYVICFSLFFYYKSSGIFFLLLVGTSIFDYTLANMVHRATKDGVKKLYLTFSVLANLGLLGYFKYTNFLIDSYNVISGSDFSFQKILLPVGISFFTFQSISYVIEIYRKEIEPTKNYVDYLFFVSFFPQLVAGPIVRAKDFLPQIYSKLNVTEVEINRAFLLIIGGVIKKVVVSDYISTNFVDRVYDIPSAYTPFENLLAAYGYSIQIYCDFSGYSDMAIGIALLLGFKLPTNFRTPYQSESITEFWRRWHISLSTWLKDFLYISVGGNRAGSFAGFLFPILFFVALLGWGIYELNVSMIPLIVALSAIGIFTLSFLLSKNGKKTMFTDVNLLTTMLLGGLWHGASLRFIVWGALHGIALAVHKLFMEYFPDQTKSKFASKLWTVVSVIITFHFVAFCWIFFRAKDFSVALEVIENIGKITYDPQQWWIILTGYTNVVGLMIFAFVWHYLPEGFVNKMQLGFIKLPLLGKAIVMAFIYWLVYATAQAGPQPFIY
ncbi:MAG: MBOAT family protein, partial [Flavobacterium sp.]|nr:MBOAT family protein [Candidatus Neoflavobacterium equi]